jgi:hypothetical protein
MIEFCSVVIEYLQQKIGEKLERKGFIYSLWL